MWDSYLNQSHPLENIGIYYIVNNTTDKTVELLKEKQDANKFKEITFIEKNIKGLGRDYGNSTDRHLTAHPHLVRMFNQCLEYGLENNYDFISVFGSDVQLGRDNIKDIISHDVDAIAPLVDLTYKSKACHQRYNLWGKRRKARYSIIPNWAGLKKLTSEYITGLTLKQQVIRSGIRFQYVPDIPDEWEFKICDDIRKKGFGVHMDTNIKAIHMRAEPNKLRPYRRIGVGLNRRNRT